MFWYYSWLRLVRQTRNLKGSIFILKFEYYIFYLGFDAVTAYATAVLEISGTTVGGVRSEPRTKCLYNLQTIFKQFVCFFIYL